MKLFYKKYKSKNFYEKKKNVILKSGYPFFHFLKLYKDKISYTI